MGCLAWKREGGGGGVGMSPRTTALQLKSKFNPAHRKTLKGQSEELAI